MSAFSRLENVSKKWPDVFDLIDIFVKAKHEGEYAWPDWCFLPISAWIAIAERWHEGEPRMQTVSRMAEIVAPCTWRYTQGVYEFDPDIYTELMASDFTGKLPSESLLRLPEWCVYIKTPLLSDADGDIEGFFAFLESDYNTKRKELRMYLDRVGRETMEPIVLHLGDWTLDESIERMLEVSIDNLNRQGVDADFLDAKAEFAHMRALAKQLLPLVLYLCTEEPEIEDRDVPDWTPHNPVPKKVRGEFRMMPAKKPHHYMLGSKTGAMLRKARKEAFEHEPTGRTVTPHIRKAHWHGFWTGPRKGPQAINQRFVLKWLPPIFVQGSQVGEG